MLSIPRSNSTDFEHLVAICGGRRRAADLLGVAVAEVDRWLKTGSAPVLALRLLWLGGPLGQEATATDLHTRARMADVCVEALQRQLSTMETELTQRLSDAESRLAAARRLLDEHTFAAKVGAVCRSLAAQADAIGQAISELSAIASAASSDNPPEQGVDATTAANASQF